MADALEIGLSALRAHQRALEVAGHNIANASTAGYSRQITSFTTPQPESVTPGMLGRGVEVDAVRRSVDDLLIERLRQAQSEGQRLERIHSVLSSVESTFDEPGDSGFAASVNRFFAAFEDLSSNPEASPMRAAIVSE